MRIFGDIYGNEGIVHGLKRAVAAGRAPHAAVFSGVSGLGKLLLAETLAKSLQCEGRAPGDAEPCGVCVSCRTFESGNHPDIFYVRATKTKAIGVDDVRTQIVANMATPPYKYPYKIFIVNHADTLSAAAQNALLKTIEEPSDFGVFLLVCENESKLLPTVLSRSVLFKLKPMPFGLVADYLTDKQGLDPAKSADIAAFSGGSIGRALSLINDEGFAEMLAGVTTVTERVQREPAEELFAIASCMEAYKERIQEALDIMLVRYRDAAAALAAGKPCKHGHGLTLKQALNNCDAVFAAKRQLESYGHFQMVMETLLFRLQEDIKEI